MGQCGRHYLVDCDALICNDSRVLLGVKTADCLPIFIVGDGYFSVVHAGRVGTLDLISFNVAVAMRAYGVSNVSVWFGPASCVCCYEIDANTRTHFDLILSNRSQIQRVYPNASVYFSGDQYQCTQCAPDAFYSFRHR